MNFFTYHIQEKGFSVALEDFIFSPKANLGTIESTKAQLPVDKWPHMLGINTGNPGVSWANPYPYPSNPYPTSCGWGFCGYGYRVKRVKRVNHGCHGSFVVTPSHHRLPLLLVPSSTSPAMAMTTTNTHHQPPPSTTTPTQLEGQTKWQHGSNSSSSSRARDPRLEP